MHGSPTLTPVRAGRDDDPTLERLYTVNELAEYLRASRSTARRLVEEGLIDSIKIGNLRRIRASQVAAYINSLTRSAA